MLYRPTTRLPWDDLDAQECGADVAPDWSSLIVVGPIKQRNQYGQLTLEWTVTAQCRPVSGTQQPRTVAATPPPTG